MNMKIDSVKTLGQSEEKETLENKCFYQSPVLVRFGDLRTLVLGASGYGADTHTRKVE